MSNNQSAAGQVSKRHKAEGPKKHIIAFIFSILLTLIAFITVSSGGINKDLIYIILIGTAILQVFVQMAFWMHMKERGHIFPLIGILAGVFVVFLFVAMAVYWVWW